MSKINEFARDLVKRQIQIYKENKSEKFDMTQPLSVLICCSIIIFSDYLEKNGKDTLIGEIKNKDKEKRQIKEFIKTVYSDKLEKRIKVYSGNRRNDKKNDFIKKELAEYEVFFHDLRNEFAHMIETNTSRLEPNTDGDFNQIIIKYGTEEININKEQIIAIIGYIDECLNDSIAKL